MKLKRTRTVLLAALGVAVLSVAPASLAKQGEHGGGKDKEKTVGYVFKGTYNADGTVAVTKGNKHVRNADLVGQNVAFDLSQAKVTVADTNGDGTSDLTDVAEGDAVVVKAKLPKSDPGVAPYAAKHLIDQTHAPEEPADEPAPAV